MEGIAHVSFHVVLTRVESHHDFVCVQFRSLEMGKEPQHRVFYTNHISIHGRIQYRQSRQVIKIKSA